MWVFGKVEKANDGWTIGLEDQKHLVECGINNGWKMKPYIYISDLGKLYIPCMAYELENV